MIYYFNLYDSRHYGRQLNQIDEDTYQSFLEGEDEDTDDLNVVVVQLIPLLEYWINIPEDYNYWDNSTVLIFNQKPAISNGFLFSLKYNYSSQNWDSLLL